MRNAECEVRSAKREMRIKCEMRSAKRGIKCEARNAELGISGKYLYKRYIVWYNRISQLLGGSI